jgi:hypothetical protein
MAVRLLALRAGRASIYPQEDSCFSFLLESEWEVTVRLGGLDQFEILINKIVIIILTLSIVITDCISGRFQWPMEIYIYITYIRPY